MNPSRALEHHADRFPDRLAVAYGEESVSYGELYGRVRLTAGALASAGAGKGDVVAVLLHNSLDFVELMFAASYVGAIFMPLNWRLSPPELAYVVNHAESAVFVTETELEASILPVRDDLTCGRFIRAGGESDAVWESLDELRERGRAPDRPVAAAAGDVLRLMYTSGTTSRPKGVMVTYGNLDAKCWAHCVELGFSRDDRGLVAGPLYHVGALDLTFTTLLSIGAYARVIRRFDPCAVLDAIESDLITTLWLAPVMVNLILSEPSLPERDLSSVRVLIDGGEKMPLPLIERILTAFPNAWFADAYGLTETVSGDTFLNKGQERHKLGSVGKPVVNLELRIVDEYNQPLPPGRPGEIVLRGPKVCPGYWRDAEATERAFRDGWFHTGDVGVIDEDGYLFIVDRLKDMVISGGENISSLEVERALYEHDAVIEAAVVGRPDERWGEVPIAYVVLKGNSTVGEEQLIGFCRERLASYKVPKAIRTIDALPRTPSGKVLKRELRELERPAPRPEAAVSDR